MRLDVYLVEKGYVCSRTEAKKFISAGGVKINGKIVTKPAHDVEGEAEIEVDTGLKKYVSRGGLKLEAALLHFGISPDGKNAIDIGASSGGFTDCLLKFGASHVISVDSGTDQLAASLRSDSRVTCIENFNARYMSPDDFEYISQIAVMDVSFISATYLIKPLYDCLLPGADFICLIKPQFEVGRSNVGKGGIVKDEKIRNSARDAVVNFAKSVGFDCLGTMISPIAGGDGNIEFLAHFKKI